MSPRGTESARPQKTDDRLFAGAEHPGRLTSLTGNIMTRPSEKLVTGKQWALALSALLAGECRSLYKRYRDNGTIDTFELITAIVALVFGVGLISVMFWYANLPESDDS